MSIQSYYILMFNLMQHHKYSLRDLNIMYPYERDIYVELLEQFIKQEKEKELE